MRISTGTMPCACHPLQVVDTKKHNLFVHPACNKYIIFFLLFFIFLTSYIFREQHISLLTCIKGLYTDFCNFVRVKMHLWVGCCAAPAPVKICQCSRVSFDLCEGISTCVYTHTHIHTSAACRNLSFMFLCRHGCKSTVQVEV